MFNEKKVVVVMPAYNAEATIVRTYNEVMDQGIVDIVIVVDDSSHDDTLKIVERLPQTVVFQHEDNLGYGANQKSCYRLALEHAADIVIMVHPDYQYTPKLIPSMCGLINSGLYHCVLGSRILGGYAVKKGMPFWKYVANRILTFVENLILGAKLSEYHTGYRAFSRELLQQLHLDDNSDDFVFDNQMLAQILWMNYEIAEITCPTKYFPEASSINFTRSCKYGLGCLATAFAYRRAKWGFGKSKLFRST